MTHPCFICGVIPQGTQGPPPSENDHHLLQECLQTIFLLRHVLDLPSPFLEGFLLRHGHPSEWVSFCVPCNEELSKGRDLFLEIHRLQKDLNTLRNVIRDKVMVKREPGSEMDVSNAAIEIKDFLWGTYDNAEEDGINESPNPSLLQAVLGQQENVDFPQLFEDFKQEDAKMTVQSQQQGFKKKKRKRKNITQFKKGKSRSTLKRKAEAVAAAEVGATTPTSSGRGCRMKQRTDSLPIPIPSDFPIKMEDTTSNGKTDQLLLKRKRGRPRKDSKIEGTVYTSDNNECEVGPDPLATSTSFIAEEDEDFEKEYEEEDIDMNYSPPSNASSSGGSGKWTTTVRLKKKQTSSKSKLKRKLRSPSWKKGELKPKKLYETKTACFLCSSSKMFDNLDEFEDHFRSSHVVPSSLTCSGCGVLFMSRQLFSTHIQEEFEKCGDHALSCDSCFNLFFSSEEALNIHQKLVHKKRKEKCWCFCGFAGRIGPAFYSHFKEKHLYTLHDFEKDNPPVEDLSSLPSPISYKDTFSFYIFKLKEFYRQKFKMSKESWASSRELMRKKESALFAYLPILLSQYGVTSIPCSFCHSNVFQDLEELSKHLEACGANPGFKCEHDQCSKTFDTKRLLEHHVRVSHTPKEDLTCGGCGTLFLQVKEFGKHVRLLPEDDFCKQKALLCEEIYCRGQGIYLSSDAAFKIHKNTRHIKEPAKLFFCMFYKDCGKSFTTMRGVTHHLEDDHKNADDPKEIICHLCGGVYTNSGFREHLKRVHATMEPGAARFFCDICGKGMVSTTKLRRHKQIHIPPEEAPHPCTICGKRFRLREYLVIHTRSHDPDRREKYSSYKPRKKKPPGYQNVGVAGARKGRPPKMEQERVESNQNSELYSSFNIL